MPPDVGLEDFKKALAEVPGLKHKELIMKDSFRVPVGTVTRPTANLDLIEDLFSVECVFKPRLRFVGRTLVVPLETAGDGSLTKLVGRAACEFKVRGIAMVPFEELNLHIRGLLVDSHVREYEDVFLEALREKRAQLERSNDMGVADSSAERQFVRRSISWDKLLGHLLAKRTISHRLGIIL